MEIISKNKKNQEIEFSVTANAEDIKKAREQALQELSNEVNIPGFRKGQAPPKEVISRVGEYRILQETLEVLVSEGYRKVLQEEKISPLTTPSIEVKDQEELLGDEPSVTFTITITPRPEIKLPDYKNLNVTYEEPTITPEQTKEAVKELFERWKEAEKSEGKTQNAENEIVTATNINEAKQKAQEGKKEQHENLIKVTKEHPDDEWAQMIGATNLDDLKQRLHQNLILESNYVSGNKFTQAVIETLIQETKIELPEKLIQDDLQARIQKKQEELEKIGLDLEGFATKNKLSVDELKEKWLEDIQKEYALEFIIAEIGERENISISDEELDTEIRSAKDAETLKIFHDPERREHLRYLMRRDKIMRRIVEWNLENEERKT